MPKKQVINNFDEAFPPLHDAVFNKTDEEVFALIANPPSKGLELEVVVSFFYYDVTSLSTTLGTAVKYFSSPAVIAALLEAGANPKARIHQDGEPGRTPLQLMRWLRKNALRNGGTIEEFAEFWLEFCGRGPTKEWFEQVEALLLAAEAKIA